MTAAPGRVVVIGSANVDLTVQVERLPQVGETVSGGDFRLSFGGKGANQALAARLAGAPVFLIAKLGGDANGDLLYRHLTAAGLDAAGLLRDAEAPSGVALIMVDAAGRNLIAVAPGSNRRLSVADVQGLEAQAFAIAPSAASGLAPDAAPRGILLTQLEVPLDTVAYALRRGREAGLLTILNPAPGRPLSEALLTLPHIITPNETEAALLSGIAVADAASARRAGERLLALGCSTVIVTLAANGCLLLRRHEVRHFPAFPVAAVDSTAAGDAFNGVLAASLLEGLPLEQAIVRANAAGALCVTRRGAQESLPTRDELDAFLAAVG
jgi:ribokinase